MSKNKSKKGSNFHINKKLSLNKQANNTFQKIFISKDLLNNKNSNLNHTIIKKIDKKHNLFIGTKFIKNNNSYINKIENKSFSNNNISTINIKKLMSIMFKRNKHKRKRRKLKYNISSAKNKTVFQQIIEDIDKVKIKTNKTLDIIKKNVTISNKEVSNRANKIFTYNKLIKNIKSYSFRNHLYNKKNESFQNGNHRLNINFLENYSLKEDTLKLNLEKYTSKENSFENKITNNLGMIKIPSISLNSFKIKKKRYNSNDKMFHFRNFYLSEEILENKYLKLFINNNLPGNNTYIKESKLQLNDILNKMNLVIDNIEYFKSNYMNKREFYSAFINMVNKQKAEFNSVLEEICVLLIKIVPKLLKEFYENIDKLLYVNIPNINHEMKKKPDNEKECLRYNLIFFNNVNLYFLASFDILKEISKTIEYFKYSYSEYIILNKYLNLARYDSSKINVMANVNVLKTKNDKEILQKFEIGLGIKIKKNNSNDNILERYNKRQHQKKEFQDIPKLERINSCLNFKTKSNKIYSSQKSGKNGLNGNLEKKEKKSLLNNPIVLNMMKYFNNNVKSQIISQKVVERHRIKEQCNK